MDELEERLQLHKLYRGIMGNEIFKGSGIEKIRLSECPKKDVQNLLRAKNSLN